MPVIYQEEIAPNIRQNITVCFASGYNIAYKMIELGPDLDIIMTSCKTGEGIAEWTNWLRKEIRGFLN